MELRLLSWNSLIGERGLIQISQMGSRLRDNESNSQLFNHVQVLLLD